MSEQAEATIPRWDLADRLRKSLREADMSVQEMSRALEVSRNTVGSWINGHHRPRPSDLKQWALVTGVSYSWLLHGDGSAPASRFERESAGSEYGPTDNLADLRYEAARKDLRGLIRRGTFTSMADPTTADLPIANTG